MRGKQTTLKNNSEILMYNSRPQAKYQNTYPRQGRDVTSNRKHTLLSCSISFFAEKRNKSF